MKRKLTIIIIMAAMLSTQGLVAQTANQDTTIVMPATGIMAIHPSRNFTGDKGLVVCSCFDSKTSGLYFTKYILNEVIVGSSANSSSALFLLGKPGTYTLTLTDDEVTGRFNTTVVSWQAESGQAYKKSRTLYKFVNTEERIGFERDEKYAADNYQYCDLAEGEHIFLPLSSNNLPKIAELLETSVAELAFIPFNGPWKNVPTAEDIEAADITDMTTSQPESLQLLYDLQGRPLPNGQTSKGIVITHGKKLLK